MRTFKYQEHVFADPGPEWSIDDIKQSLAATFPEIAQSTTSTRTMADGTEEITFVKKSGTKGQDQPDTRSITVGSTTEAIAKARRIFADEPAVDWIIATGDSSLAGVFLEGTKGDLVLHRSELGGWAHYRPIETVKQEILAELAKLAPAATVAP